MKELLDDMGRGPTSFLLESPVLDSDLRGWSDLVQVIIAKSRVPSAGHHALKAGHFNSQSLRSLAISF
jgi:hypothetical protein